MPQPDATGTATAAAHAAPPLVMIPTYNEVGNITTLVHALMQQTPAVDILFVDDESVDGTQDAIARMQHQYGSRVHLLARTGPRGLGSAYRAGLQWALAHDYAVVIQMDADLSHDPQELPHLLARLAEADVIVGSRYVAGGKAAPCTTLRGCLSRAGALYTRWLLGLPLHDPTGGYTVWRRRVLEALHAAPLHSHGYVVQVEWKYRASRAGFRLVEVPIVFRARQCGASKMSLRIVVEALWRPWHLRGALR
jgi:glycosyltransferase involved in cell wall biosynthesis